MVCYYKEGRVGREGCVCVRDEQGYILVSDREGVHLACMCKGKRFTMCTPSSVFSSNSAPPSRILLRTMKSMICCRSVDRNTD